MFCCYFFDSRLFLGFSLQMLGSSDFPVGEKNTQFAFSRQNNIAYCPVERFTPTAISLFYTSTSQLWLPVCTRCFFFLSLKADWWIFNRLSVCFYGSLPHEFFSPSAGTDHLRRAVQTASFPPTRIRLVICVSLWEKEKKEKQTKNCFLLYCCCKEKEKEKKKHKIFLPVFQLFQAHDWLSRGRILQKQWGRRRQSKVRQCAQIILHECTFLCKLCLFFSPFVYCFHECIFLICCTTSSLHTNLDIQWRNALQVTFLMSLHLINFRLVRLENRGRDPSVVWEVNVHCIYGCRGNKGRDGTRRLFNQVGISRFKRGCGWRCEPRWK